jgi:hypothetical protein
VTEAEWNASDDAGAMLDFLWQQQGIPPRNVEMRSGGNAAALSAARHASDDLARTLHRYYLTCCRRILLLLPEQGSRDGVEMGEQFLNGAVSAEALSKFNWHTEAAAFGFDYNTHPEYTDPLVAEVRALSKGELRSMLHPPEIADEIEPRELLTRAAYFADYAMTYSSCQRRGPPPDSYCIFLCSDALREHVSYPRPSPRH